MRLPHLAAAILVACVFCCTAIGQSADDTGSLTVENPVGDITLPRVLLLTLEQNPGLAVYGWDIRAAEARELQARLRPNPELAFEVEDIRLNSGPSSQTSTTSITSSPTSTERTVNTANGPVTFAVPGRSFVGGIDRSRESGAESGLSESEITLSIAQVIELGGKRARRMKLADRYRDVTQWDYEVARADAITGAAKAYYTVLAAQDRVSLAEDLTELARQMRDTIAARVAAGKVSAIEESRGEVAFGNVELELDQARRELAMARAALASWWGAQVPAFDRAIGEMAGAQSPPPLESLAAEVESTPDMARWQAEILHREANVDLQRANGKPDLTVSFGIRSTGQGSRSESTGGITTQGDLSFGRSSTTSEEARDYTFLLGFSLPLPLFDRNQGNIQEAEHLVSKAAAERRAEAAGIRAGIAAAYYRLDAAYVVAHRLDTAILPKAQEAFDATQEGYRQGKFGLLDVLTAEQSLFDARVRLLESRTAYFQALADMERLTGQVLYPANESPATQEELP